MSTTIKYKNKFNIKITKQQANQLSTYKIVEKIDGVARKIIEYYKNRLDHVIFYIEPIETDLEVLATLKSLHPLCEVFTILERGVLGDYNLITQRKYINENETPIISKFLENSDGNPICTEQTTLGLMFLTDDSQQSRSIRTKHFYDPEVYENNLEREDEGEIISHLVFEAFYKPNGELDIINFFLGSIHHKTLFDEDNYAEVVAICGLNADQAAYYLTDTFLPEGSEV